MKIWAVLLAALIASVLAVGCSKEQNQPPEPPAPTATVDPSTAGDISGKVTFEGKPPELRAIDMSAEPECVKANPKPVYPPEVVTGEHDALANVVVYVKSGLGSYRYDQPTTPAVLDQHDCMYAPHVFAVMTHQPIEIRNTDPTVHNIHPMPRVNHPWNRSEEPGDPPFQANFSHAELAIPIVCNVHPWMRAFLFVFDNPYFAVTTTSGTFDLKGLPPGTYTIEAWQERYGKQDQTVTLGPKESKALSFTFKSAPPPRRESLESNAKSGGTS